MEKVSKRVNAIQEVKESVGLLTQLLGDYSKEIGSHSNEELIKVSNTYVCTTACHTPDMAVVDSELLFNSTQSEQQIDFSHNAS